MPLPQGIKVTTWNQTSLSCSQLKVEVRHPRSMSTGKRKQRVTGEIPLATTSVVSLSRRFLQALIVHVRWKTDTLFLRTETPCCVFNYLYLKLLSILRPSVLSASLHSGVIVSITQNKTQANVQPQLRNRRQGCMHTCSYTPAQQGDEHGSLSSIETGLLEQS